MEINLSKLFFSIKFSKRLSEKLNQQKLLYSDWKGFIKVKMFQGFLAETNQNALRKNTKIAIDSQYFTLNEVKLQI